MNPRRTRRAKAIFAVVVVLVLCEGAARYSDHKHHRDPNPMNHIRAGAPSLRGFGPMWYVGRNHEEIKDSRDRMHPYKTDKLRIVCLGGSTTHGQPSNDYPGFLNELLPDTDVINAGFAAYTTVHTIATLADNAIAWKPDIVIVSDGVNDQSAGYLNLEYEENWRPDLEHRFGRYSPAGEFSRWATPINTVFQWSHLYWYLKRKPREMELERKFGSARGDKPQNSNGEYIRIHSYGPTPPAEPLEGFRTNIETIVRIAQGRTRLVFLTQPYSGTAPAWHEMLAHKPQWKEGKPLSPPPEEMELHHRVYNQTVREVAARFNVQVIDGEAAVTRSELFADSVHLTVDGNKALAKVVEEGLGLRKP